MTHIDFFPYHNFHIRFKLVDGKELSGVLADTLIPHETGEPDTVYSFIATTNMIEWKQAEQKGNTVKMKNLQEKIDIRNIVWAEKIKY